MLPEIAQSQAATAYNFAAVEFFLAEDDSEQRTFPRPIPPDETDLHRIADGHVGMIQQDLVAVSFGRVDYLNQSRHRRSNPPKKSKPDSYDFLRFGDRP